MSIIRLKISSAIVQTQPLPTKFYINASLDCRTKKRDLTVFNTGNPFRDSLLSFLICLIGMNKRVHMIFAAFIARTILFYQSR